MASFIMTIQNQKAITVTMIFMEITHIDIMQKDTYIQTLMKKMTKIYFTIILFFCFLSGCALSPGMFLSYSNNWDGEDIIFIESLNIPITIEPINKDLKIEKLKETCNEIGNKNINYMIADETIHLPSINQISKLMKGIDFKLEEEINHRQNNIYYFGG